MFVFHSPTDTAPQFLMKPDLSFFYIVVYRLVADKHLSGFRFLDKRIDQKGACANN